MADELIDLCRVLLSLHSDRVEMSEDKGISRLSPRLIRDDDLSLIDFIDSLESRSRIHRISYRSEFKLFPFRSDISDDRFSRRDSHPHPERSVEMEDVISIPLSEDISLSEGSTTGTS